MSASERMRLDAGWLRSTYENAQVSLAAKGKFDLIEGPGHYLPAHLWEPLRLELQRRWREATGEKHAILTVKDPTP